MKVIYPGTFDPITKGHLDVIERASALYDEVDVVIMVNPRKTCTFSQEERLDMIRRCIGTSSNMGNVNVNVGSGLTVDYARKMNAKGIIRGIRAVSDYEYELSQATANMMLAPEIETIFLIAKPEYSFLSSSVVKEIAVNGGDISRLIPEEIIPEVKEKLKK